MRKILALSLAGMVCLTAVGCKGNNAENTSLNNQTVSVSENLISDDNTSWDNYQKTNIALNKTTAEIDGNGASVDGSSVLITQPGVYTVSGELSDGQIKVTLTKEEKAKLILNGVTLSCSESAPVYVESADKIVIELADSSVNTLSDKGTAYVDDTEDNNGLPNAVLFSKDDLTIKGSGTLSVNATANNGITSKNDLKITGGTIKVTSEGNGIKGKDSVSVKDADITVNADSDGIKTDNALDEDKGCIYFESGTFNINSGEDGVQADRLLSISGGTYFITTGGGSSVSSSAAGWGNWNNNSSESSAKALKCDMEITIDDGEFNIDSSDDSIHSNDTITVNGGQFKISSGDDGIHADNSLTINNGTINIAKSYEGVEALKIIVNGGELTVVSSDDGMNAAGGSDDSAVEGRPGQNTFGATNGANITINGGYIYLNASGDGIDSNDTINMTGGTLIIDGPVNDGNGAIDYETSFTATGGFIVAAGSSGMAETLSSSSSVYSIMTNFTSAYDSDTIVHIEDSKGNDILTYSPSKKYSSVVVASENINNGETYVIYTGGTYSGGTEKNGIYSGGTYNKGTEYQSVTISSVVTTIGQTFGGMGGGGRPGMMMR